MPQMVIISYTPEEPVLSKPSPWEFSKRPKLLFRNHTKLWSPKAQETEYIFCS